MAGLSAAWRLSEAGWRDRFESITVYQRGWRLGGKGASGRGVHGRIEEHGLHIWLGYYENAFALLRECYAELDRPATDPRAPLQRWDEALIPADDLGLADRGIGHDNAGWNLWLGRFTRTDDLPGDPDRTSREMTVVEFLRRAVGLLIDFAATMPDDTLAHELALTASPQLPRRRARSSATFLRRGIVAVLIEVIDVTRAMLTGEREGGAGGLGPLEGVLATARQALGDTAIDDDLRRSWLLVSLMTAVIRGLLADELLTDPRGFAAINDEDFGDWILRHGADEAVLDFALVRGLYDLVFGYHDGDPERPGFAAGLAVFLTGKTLFEYTGSIFWKMTAGMGDVVFAPIYEVLHRRGVNFEFFHRVDQLHLDPARRAVDTIALGRQVELAADVDEYSPLVRLGGLPVFPSSPVREQLARPMDADLTFESHLARRADVESRTLRRGTDFDDVVLAVPVAMISEVATELIDDRVEWREMVDNVATVATQAFQVWLAPDERALGFDRHAVTVSGYVSPFETWSSMPQTLWAEQWPDGERPRTVAYFCNALAAPWPADEDPLVYERRHHERVRQHAVAFLDRYGALYFPNAVTDEGFAWHLLCGSDGATDASAFDSQYWTANVDPSDRYVQSLPGTDRYRLRPDESGYDNVVLAGDWTDSGLNAGCIEAAVVSGLQAANALLGRARHHRLRGYYLD